MLFVGEIGGLDGAKKQVAKISRKKRERKITEDMKNLSDQACWREGAEGANLLARKLRVDMLLWPP